MNPLIKAIIGVILVIASLYYILYPIKWLPRTISPALPDVIVVLNGAIPVFVLLLGIFIIWLEWDEWKIEKELEKEEKKLKKKSRKKRKK